MMDPKSWLSFPELDAGFSNARKIQEPIDITGEVKCEGRKLHFLGDGGLVNLIETDDHGTRTVTITAEEMAMLLLSSAGQFQERVQAEIDRLVDEDREKILEDQEPDDDYYQRQAERASVRRNPWEL